MFLLFLSCSQSDGANTEDCSLLLRFPLGFLGSLPGFPPTSLPASSHVHVPVLLSPRPLVFHSPSCCKGFPGGSAGKASTCNAGDLGSIPGSGRSPGEGNGNTLQYSCLEKPMDGGACWATVHGVAKSWTQLRDFTHFVLENTPSALVSLRIWSPTWTL